MRSTRVQRETGQGVIRSIPEGKLNEGPKGGQTRNSGSQESLTDSGRVEKGEEQAP